MNFLLINLTDYPIPITRTNMEKITVLPHKHYLIETIHTPEINFWQKCTDRRFKIITNQDEISRYLKVISNQERAQTKQSNAVTESNNNELVNIKVDATDDQNEKIVEQTKYTEEQLVSMKVVELKELASALNITLPTNANKATIVSTIFNNQ